MINDKTRKISREAAENGEIDAARTGKFVAGDKRGCKRRFLYI